jgi:hypothetical protein
MYLKDHIGELLCRNGGYFLRVGVEEGEGAGEPWQLEAPSGSRPSWVHFPLPGEGRVRSFGADS